VDKMSKKTKLTMISFLIFSLVLLLGLVHLNGGLPIANAGESVSNPGPNLLEDWFGVELKLQPPYGGAGDAFILDSFKPTKNLATVDWVCTDWYGDWTFNNGWQQTTVWGQEPSYGEWYDTEAYYFDNDENNLYMAIVTSCPFYKDWTAEVGAGGPGVGVYDKRFNWIDNKWIRPGDLSLNLGYSTPRQERWGTTWSYDYGLDIVHENRDSYVGGNIVMRDNELGKALYKTKADSGGNDIRDPGPGYDWYTGSYLYTPAGWEHTNFDPSSGNSSSILTKLGDETNGIKVNYYLYQPSEWDGKRENNADTWIIEATIPLNVLPAAEKPLDGQKIGLRWTTACRNDDINSAPVALLWGDVDFPSPPPPPPGEVNFEVTKEVDQTIAYPGDTLKFIINYKNTGNAAAHNVVITDNPDPTYLENIAPLDGGAFNGTTITWQVGEVGPGKSGFVHFTAKVKPNVPEGTIIKNVANLNSDETNIYISNETKTEIKKQEVVSYGKVLGNGKIAPDNNFVFDIVLWKGQNQPSGKFIYFSRLNRISIKCLSPSFLKIDLPNKKAEFGGSCTGYVGNEQAASFKASIEDKDGAGGKDKFTVEIKDKNGKIIHQASGDLISGYVSILTGY